MAVYLILAAAILVYGKVIHANRSDKRKRWFLIVSFGAMILLAALRAPTVGIDLAGHYGKRYTQIADYRWSEIPAFTGMSKYEIGYCYFCKLLSVICPDVQFFIAVTSAFTCGTMGLFFYRKSSDVVLSTELMLMLGIYYAQMNVIRQELAIAIILLGYLFYSGSRRRWQDGLIFALFCILAATFHTSAFVCISFLLICKFRFRRRDILLVLAGTAIIFLAYEELYLFIASILGRGAGYVRKAEGQGNFNSQSFANFLLTAGAFALGYYVLVYRKQQEDGRRESRQEESFLLYMSLMAALCRMLLFRMNIINRVSYYFLPFTLVMYPCAIDAIPVRQVRKHYRGAVYCTGIAYYFWITIRFAKSFYGVVPYIPFWQGG